MLNLQHNPTTSCVPRRVYFSAILHGFNLGDLIAAPQLQRIQDGYAEPLDGLGYLALISRLIARPTSPGG